MSALDGACRFAREALAIVSAWWRTDRVRVSPREGRLLRLEPPCFLILEGRLAEVLDRKQDPGGEEPRVSYSCLTDSGRGELLVKLGEGGCRLQVSWVDAAGERSLEEGELSVYPSRTG